MTTSFEYFDEAYNFTNNIATNIGVSWHIIPNNDKNSYLLI